MRTVMEPMKVYDHLRRTYLRYLETSFFFKERDLQDEFKRVLRDRAQPPLVREPILEVSPAFKEARTIADLVSDGVLSSAFLDLGQRALPPRLYAHQEAGIRMAVTKGRNLVVATGTGSGKTEVFLIPILQRLLREKELGTLTEPGVRALLLYPMNALANDQVARLRTLLAAVPDVLFGRYTGETGFRFDNARDLFLSRHGQEPQSNELICRDQIRETPPHILLTNYAMLEYLLIRPDDSPLFGGQRWRFIVLDEVHTYCGATGIEIAMLLRRLKERVVRSRAGVLQCFATSATLGNGARDHPRIARFVTELFGERFTPDDIVEAELGEQATCPSWGRGSPTGYRALREALSVSQGARFPDLLDAARRHFPSEVVEGADPGGGQDRQRCRAFLGRVLEGDENLADLRTRLRTRNAVELRRLDDEEGVVDLVALSAFARARGSRAQLLPARYHIMARALTGLCGWFDSTSTLHLLARRARRYTAPSGERVAVFEIGSCNRCGELFIVGVEEDEWLVQPPDVGDDPVAKLSWFILDELSENQVVNEDDAVEARQDLAERHSARLTPMRLCRVCGRVGASRTFSRGSCVDHAAAPIAVFKVENKPRRPGPRGCPSCGNFFGRVASRALTGKEVPVAVLATALYQNIPPSVRDEDQETPGGGRKLIVFSDSRQDAAFFAPFMAQTYAKVKQRRYLALALDGVDGPVDLGEWARRARRVAEKANEWDEEVSSRRRTKDAGSWVLREWVAYDRRLSLEGTGVVSFALRRPRAFNGLALLREPPWGLDDAQQWSLIRVLLDTLRLQGVVSLDQPDEDSFQGIEHSDTIFAPRNRQLFVRGANSVPKSGICSWAPDSSRTNKRLDYLMRVLARKGVTEEHCEQNARRALHEVWTAIQHRNGPLAKLFEKGLKYRREGNLSRLLPTWWQVQATATEDVLRCDTCASAASAAVEAVCSMARCPGTVTAYDVAARRQNHYYDLFTTMRPIPMEVREHTGQLERGAASRTQQDFIDGVVNVLSCTTTFEMGIDVGDLHSVLMRNIPPSPGNYAQRAGRAGRRADSVAVIVSYAQRRTHDLAYFDDWPRMVKGSIRPPAIRIANHKIVKRHVHAEALAEYFRHHPEVFADRLDSVFDPARDVPGEILAFLREHPAALRDRLGRIVPAKLQGEVGLDTWAWLETGADGGDSFASRLRVAVDDVQRDWQILSDAEEGASREADYRKAGLFQKQLNTLRRRSLLGRLGTYGLMPKYGFPTDVVELKVRSSSREASQLELTRDMKLALTEFAPENQIIAAGRVWTSDGIVLPVGERRLHEYLFWSCQRCEFFAAERAVAVCDDGLPSRECHCGEMQDGHLYVYPEFGFTTSVGRGDRVGDSRPPARSYAWSFFQDTSASRAPEPVQTCPWVQHIPETHGWIHVINDNRGRDFYVCLSCGFAALLPPIFVKKTPTHKKPWSADKTCRGRLVRRALGYCYGTDVIELRFPRPAFLSRDDEPESFWLSLSNAVVGAACLELEIDRRDIDGCLHFTERNHPSVVLFDTSPGGAGLVFEVRDNLGDVLRRARSVVDCKSCSEDSSCVACLRTYSNQRYHNKLRRGLVLDYLTAEGS